MASKNFLFLILIFAIYSCGRNLPSSTKSQTIIANGAVSISQTASGGPTANSASGTVSDNGTLTVPSIPVSQGGYFTLTTGGNSYVVRTQSASVKTVLKSLFDDQANLGGNKSIQFRVHFVGTTSVSSCNGSPSGKCRIITLNSIQAY